MKDNDKKTKVAFAIWNDRIAPVFDTAGLIHIIETEGGKVTTTGDEFLAIDLLPVEKAMRLKELGVETLVCGAISRPLYETIKTHGIWVIPFVAGNLEEVVKAWLTGSCDWNAFAMPGCYGRRRYQYRQMYGSYEEDFFMNGRRSGGGVRGTGRGQGRRGQGLGRMGGTLTAGPSGYCVCPQCGQKEPHQHGIPCFEQKCPKCGSAMAREQ